VTFKP